MIIRVDQSKFNQNQWKNFIDAMLALKQDTKYSDLVRYHSNHNHHHHNIHVYPYFLSWHRKYIRIFEENLINVGYDDALPYWNWTTDLNVPGPLKLQNLNQIGWTPQLGRNAESVTNLNNEVLLALVSTTFERFSNRINSPHNSIHIQIGGDMRTDSSPDDPLFWLHHCYIDKLWADWQVIGNNNNAIIQELTQINKINTKLGFPQPQDAVPISSVLDFQQMGYKYA